MAIQGGSFKHLLRFGGTFFRIGIRLENNSKRIVVFIILSVYMVYGEIPSHTMLGLLRYRYTYNPLCPRGNLWDESCVILIRYKLACWWFKKIINEDQDQ